MMLAAKVVAAASPDPSLTALEPGEASFSWEVLCIPDVWVKVGAGFPKVGRVYSTTGGRGNGS